MPNGHHQEKTFWEKHKARLVSLTLLFLVLSTLSYYKHHNRFPLIPKTSHPVIHTYLPPPKTITQLSEKPTHSATSSSSAAQPNIYTLQLIASHDIHALRHFITAHQLQLSTHVLRTTYQGKPWYAVVYGEFKTSDQAKNARKKLPPNLQALHPWVRNLTNLFNQQSFSISPQ